MYNLSAPTPTYTPIAPDLPDNYFSALFDSESDLRERKELKSTELLILLNLNSILLNLHSLTVPAGDIDDFRNKWNSGKEFSFIIFS